MTKDVSAVAVTPMNKRTHGQHLYQAHAKVVVETRCASARGRLHHLWFKGFYEFRTARLVKRTASWTPKAKSPLSPLLHPCSPVVLPTKLKGQPGSVSRKQS